MINILQNLLDSQEVEINDHILNEGVKSDSRSSTSQIMQLIARFEALKEEGEKVKDTNPMRLLKIMSELKELVGMIKELDPRKQKDNSDKDSSDKKDDSGDALDDFKNMF
jgi:ribosomal protein S15P/S13E